MREGGGQDEAIDLAMDLDLDEAAAALSRAGGAGDQEVPAAHDGGQPPSNLNKWLRNKKRHRRHK